VVVVVLEVILWDGQSVK